MSTETELIAAAERIANDNDTDFWFCIDRLPDAAKYAKLLARHVLATVRADDWDDVTVEWLRSCCVFSGDGQITHLWITAAWRLYFIDRISRPSVMWTGGDRYLTTRGQVRDLLRALGIEVKG